MVAGVYGKTTPSIRLTRGPVIIKGYTLCSFVTQCPEHRGKMYDKSPDSAMEQVVCLDALIMYRT
jgi:hypothetical protein